MTSVPRRRIMSCRVAALVVALLAPAVTATPARAQEPSRIGAGTAVAQVALGTLGTGVGFVGGGLLTRSAARRFGASPDRASDAAYVGAWTGAALLTPVGPAIVGSRGAAHGSYPQALVGTLAGGAASYLLITAGRHGAFGCRWCGPVRGLVAVSAFVLPSVGATVAFDRSRRL
ncbi:MAG TPA: hypothetical protein VNS52_05405 [Gemmatimonadaceae bacterium]|nr:hypothetical protein [Gemmatimonadaceae bacterium]